MKKHTVQFVPSGRGKAQCEPDPEYQHGKAIDCGFNVSCFVELPYPAPECGHYLVTCNECDMCIAITAAGRPDDPISVTIPCKLTLAGDRAKKKVEQS
jgi:hypothetical protein